MLLTDKDWEKIHKKAGCDVMDIASDVRNQNINSSQLMEVIAKRCDVVAEVMHAKTLKAVAEWLDGTCENRVHGLIRDRKHCPFCMIGACLLLREGKMPGEEK